MRGKRQERKGTKRARIQENEVKQGKKKWEVAIISTRWDTTSETAITNLEEKAEGEEDR